MKSFHIKTFHITTLYIKTLHIKIHFTKKNKLGIKVPFTYLVSFVIIWFYWKTFSLILVKYKRLDSLSHSIIISKR